MDKYDPLRTPNPQQWLELDEADRQRLVLDYHRRTAHDLPRADTHAAMHVVVENQIALGDEMPVRRTAQRLIVEGLNRHEAIHAIASVLIVHMQAILQFPGSLRANTDPSQLYNEALEELTAEKWLASGG